MPTYYLRMEGVNLGSVLSDTNQISVIRGASLLLREATRKVEEEFAFAKFTKISSGASIGLFQFEALNSGMAEGKRQQVADYLSQDEQLCYFTFVVDIQAESGDFVHDKEALLARNRFCQLQQPTFAFPTTIATATKPCELTNLPASQQEKIGEEIQDVSDSVSVRFNYGREQKHDFYQQETGIDLKFTNSLKELAEPDANTPKNLGHKIAVLYLDGNDFSKIQKTHCKNPQDLRKFDVQVQTKRCQFLTCFLEKIRSDPAFFNHDKVCKVRLETLLWGGDEMLFVVPAWKGLELLNYFYQVSRDWEFEGEKLMHAGGLVFCRAKTPIRRIRKFAEELANGVKDSKGKLGRKENLFDYMVLESIDYPSESPDKLRKKIFADELQNNYQPLLPCGSKQLIALAELKEIVPKSQAYNLVRAIIQGDKQCAEKTARLKVVITDSQYLEALDKLEIAFPQQTLEWQWIHLIELWDYIVPTSPQ